MIENLKHEYQTNRIKKSLTKLSNEQLINVVHDLVKYIVESDYDNAPTEKIEVANEVKVIVDRYLKSKK